MPPKFDDETLVAFLDGELPSEEAARISDSMQSDEELRQYIEQLRATWNLLGDLPEEPPDRDLAQTTIEMVTLAIAAEKQTLRTRPWSNRWLLLGLGSLLMLASGAVFSNVTSGYRELRLREDLPAILFWANLKNVDSVSWLEKLETIEPLRRVAMDLADNRQSPTLPEANQSLNDWAKTLTESQASMLEANRQAFERETPERKAELVTLSKTIVSGDDQTPTRKTILNAYEFIISEMGSTELANVSAIENLDERAEAFRWIVRRYLATAYTSKMSWEDRQALKNWLYGVQDVFMEELFRNVQDPLQRILTELAELSPEESFIRSEQIDELWQSLSNEARELLSGFNDREQRTIISLWLLHVFESSSVGAREPTAAELKARFEALPSDRKAYLEFLPERDARRELTQ